MLQLIFFEFPIFQKDPSKFFSLPLEFPNAFRPLLSKIQAIFPWVAQLLHFFPSWISAVLFRVFQIEAVLQLSFLFLEALVWCTRDQIFVELSGELIFTLNAFLGRGWRLHFRYFDKPLLVIDAESQNMYIFTTKAIVLFF